MPLKLSRRLGADEELADLEGLVPVKVRREGIGGPDCHAVESQGGPGEEARGLDGDGKKENGGGEKRHAGGRNAWDPAQEPPLGREGAEEPDDRDDEGPLARVAEEEDGHEDLAPEKEEPGPERGAAPAGREAEGAGREHRESPGRRDPARLRNDEIDGAAD